MSNNLTERTVRCCCEIFFRQMKQMNPLLKKRFNCGLVLDLRADKITLTGETLHCSYSENNDNCALQNQFFTFEAIEIATLLGKGPCFDYLCDEKAIVAMQDNLISTVLNLSHSIKPPKTWL